MEVARLCARTDEKYGNPGWYQVDPLRELMLGMAGQAVLFTVQRGDELAAASVSVHDDGVLHNCAAGSADRTRLTFSPYQVMLYATVRYALEHGCTLLEGAAATITGRRGTGSRRYRLYAALLPVGEGR